MRGSTFLASLADIGESRLWSSCVQGGGWRGVEGGGGYYFLRKGVGGRAGIAVFDSSVCVCVCVCVCDDIEARK